MRFLKTLLWVLIAVAVALFSVRNWLPISVNLWGNQVLDTKLPVVIIAAFLLGLLPTFLLHRATRWNLKRKLDSAERALSDITLPTPPPLANPGPLSGTIAPSAAPIAVPPGVS
ncbi:MAG: hypothetical protein RLY97_1387 [Pseudomonadota bacterium]